MKNPYTVEWFAEVVSGLYGVDKKVVIILLIWQTFQQQCLSIICFCFCFVFCFLAMYNTSESQVDETSWKLKYPDAFNTTGNGKKSRKNVVSFSKYIPYAHL